MSAPELKPCPFCGGKAALTNREMPGCAFVVCLGCQAQGDDGSIERVIQKWNTRARAEAAEAKLEAVARRALERAGKEAEGRFTEYEGCGVYVYGSSVSDAIRAMDPAAIVRAVMEGKE